MGGANPATGGVITIRKEPTKRGDKVKVTFVLPDPGDGANVFVAGDFNAWSPGATPLRRQDGLRTASVTLVAGRRYAFRRPRRRRAGVADHPGVEHLDVPEPLAAAMALESTPELLDIGQLRHPSRSRFCHS